ncbi:MAG TPA: hypothetical protein VJA21_17570 [Verrucomicrobiae bacterium]
MIRAAMVCAAAVIAAGFGATAANYPLTFKTVTADQISKLPGGYGAMGDLRANKPAGIKKEPKAISRHPLYGETREDESGPRYVFRLDESKGDGKGYDRLIVDMNQNGDLTDDGVAPRDTDPADAPRVSSAPRPAWFGPIQVPAGTEFCGGRPIFFANVYLRPMAGSASGESGGYSGYVRLKAGWYLETTVNLNGAEQKIAVYDGNGNLKLGDLPEPQTYGSGTEKRWYFKPGDAFFVDADGSGAFELGPLDLEARPFGPLLCLGATPCKAALAADGKSLRLEPYTDPLAEVAIEPRGDQVRNLTLAWEHPAGKWQLLNTPVEKGRVQVPPGRYRFYYCAVFGQNSGADPVMASANQSVQKTPFKFEAGKANTLRCGAPLEVAAQAQKRTPQAYELPRDSKPDPRKDSEYIVRINANFHGADGEVYSTFAKGPKLAGNPAKPVFRVLGADGKELAKGNLEFG